MVFLLNVAPDDVADDGPHTPPEWWGEYAKCVYRWEVFMGRQAPVPLMRGPRGGLKLAPKFAEWMMGLPDGWVTDVPDLTREEQIGRIGNGVCPQQAFEAFRFLKDRLHNESTEKHTEESDG